MESLHCLTNIKTEGNQNQNILKSYHLYPPPVPQASKVMYDIVSAFDTGSHLCQPLFGYKAMLIGKTYFKGEGNNVFKQKSIFHRVLH